MTTRIDHGCQGSARGNSQWKGATWGVAKASEVDGVAVYGLVNLDFKIQKIKIPGAFSNLLSSPPLSLWENLFGE